MSYLDWKVGDRVVCVDAEGVHMVGQPLKHGKVYVIRAVYLSYESQQPSVRLEGVINPIHLASGNEVGYYARRFRKVQTRKTDISCFTAILNGHRVPGCRQTAFSELQEG